MPIMDFFDAHEAMAILLAGFVAAVIAIWGIVSQRQIMRRAATLSHLTQLEADRDLIQARNIFADLTQNPKELMSLIDAAKPVPPISENRACADPTISSDPEAGAGKSDSKCCSEDLISPHKEKNCCCCGCAEGAREVPASELSTAQKLHAIRTVFNSNELLAIGVQMEIIDFTIFQRYAKSLYVHDWDHGAPLIFTLRKLRGQPSMYHEFEEVARWLRDNNMPRRRRRLGLFF